MIKFILYSTIAIIFAACANNGSEERKDGYSKRPQTAEDSLFEEVMHGHDTAMAKMGKLGRYQKEVSAKLDSLREVGGSKLAEAEKSLNELGTELKEAEEGMNNWMDDFDIDSAMGNIERRIEYLKNEKIKVDDVKEKIFRTLEKADSLLKK
jgi:DNA repair ATPase RecN